MDNLLNILRKNQTIIATVTTACVGYLVVRRYVAGGVCTITDRVEGKTIIITGANVGIGLATAKELARRGGRVILACRNAQKGHTAVSEVKKYSGSNDVIFQQLDLASLDSVRNFCKRINESEMRLDILINNAGVMACPESKTVDGFEMQFGTNHLGHFLLTNLLLDLLKKSTPSRIINVSSRAHESGKIHFDNIALAGCYQPFTAYKQSKLANVLFTKELSKRLSNSGVVCMALHPGVIHSNLSQHLPFFVSALIKLLNPLMKTTEEGAQTTLHCALLQPPSGMVAGGLYYYSDCDVRDPAPQAKSDEDAKRLWELSEEMVGLQSREKGDQE